MGFGVLAFVFVVVGGECTHTGFATLRNSKILNVTQRAFGNALPAEVDTKEGKSGEHCRGVSPGLPAFA